MELGLGGGPSLGDRHPPQRGGADIRGGDYKGGGGYHVGRRTVLWSRARGRRECFLCAAGQGQLAVGSLAVGSLAVGSLAVGSLAVGSLAVGSLAVGSLAVGSLAVGSLAVGSLAPR